MQESTRDSCTVISGITAGRPIPSNSKFSISCGCETLPSGAARLGNRSAAERLYRLRGGGTKPAENPPPTIERGAEIEIEDLVVQSSTNRPGVKFILELDTLYSSDAVERERESSTEDIVVMDVGEIEDAAVRDAVVTALRSGEWRSNSLPDGLRDLVERVDFFTGVPKDDTYTHLGVSLYRLHPDRPPAIEFQAAVTDRWVSPSSPGALELSLTNTSQTSQEIFSGTVPPFGLVSASTDDGSRFLLWRNYVEEGCVFFSDEGIGRCDIGIITPIEAGETIARTYEILPSTTQKQPAHTVPSKPGRYRYAGGVSYNRGDGAPDSTLNFEIEFTLRDASRR